MIIGTALHLRAGILDIRTRSAYAPHNKKRVIKHAMADANQKWSVSEVRQSG